MEEIQDAILKLNDTEELDGLMNIIQTHLKTVENRDKSLFGHHNFVLFGSCAFMIVLGKIFAPSFWLLCSAYLSIKCYVEYVLFASGTQEVGLHVTSNR